MVTTRAHARQVACPKCDALPGENCWRRNRTEGRRKALHAERHRLAIANGAPELRDLPHWTSRPSGGAAALTRDGAAAEEEGARR